MADPPTDRAGLDVLPVRECLELLASRPLGRLAYLEAGEPVVVPVNHLVDGSNIVIRSLAGGKLDAAVMRDPVAFQVDDYDEEQGTGWSVLVRGRGTLVDDADDVARFADELDSWAVSDPGAATWIRIESAEVTGRRLRRADETR